MQIEHKNLTIDVDKAFKEKSPRLYKFIPRFIINFIKRLIHQDDLNKVIISAGNKTGFEFISHSLNKMQIKTTSVGLDNIPAKGGVIIVANHPLGGIDGVAFINEIGKRRKDCHILVNDILMQIKQFNPIFVPVNKHGRNSKVNIAYIDSLYALDKCIVIFPAGLVSRKQGKEIIDLEWKKSFISKAIQYKRNIIPVYISGKNSKRFYNIAYLRKIFRIKVNIEMLFLADEMVKQKGNTIKFTFGKNIYWESLDKTYSKLQWAQKIKNYIYELKNNKDLDFRDSYM